MISTTAFIALAMQCAAAVHPDTSLDVVRVESGFNPYAIAEIIPKGERKVGDKGVITHLPSSKEDAMKIVKRIESKGRRFSVGLMQITSTNFNQFNTSADRLFSPCDNLAVFEKILVDCYQRAGTLKSALSCYYSGNFLTGTRKEPAFDNTSYVERIGFTTTQQANRIVVPSTKETIKQEMTQKRKLKKNLVIYPPYVIRGIPEQIAKNGD